MATWRRPQHLPRAIASILASEHDSFEVLLADQNEFGETAENLGPLAQDPRLRIFRMAPCGVSVAQNTVAQQARGRVFAITDDDCEVAGDWIRQAELLFEEYPEAGVIVGRVTAGPHDASAGFIPAVERQADALWRSAYEKPELEVMGASMAVRAEVWRKLGGFPARVGPGASFGGGGDYDLVLRAWLSGIAVLESPRLHVFHHGFREWTAAQRLLEGYAFGTALVLGWRTVSRPSLFVHALRAYWRGYRRNASTVVGSALKARAIRPRRVGFFALGLARGGWLALVKRE
jgi:GT2 family glycosyltransferase